MSERDDQIGSQKVDFFLCLAVTRRITVSRLREILASDPSVSA